MGALAYGAMVPGYEYQTAVHSHMENAYFSNTPELMITELEAAKGGMHSLGLRNGTYGAFWGWEKTPDKKMDFQYAHIDAIIARAHDVATWRDTQSTNAGAVQSTDVYNQKMDNLRNYLKADGWSDDIAKSAFIVQNYTWLWVFWNTWVLFWASITAVHIAMFVVTDCVL